MFEELIAGLRSALEVEPQRHRLRLELASTLLHVGQYTEALDETRKVLAALPGDAQALGLAAMACELGGDPAAGAAYAALMRQGGAILSAPALSAGREQIGLTVPLIGFSDVVGALEEKRRLESHVIGRFRHRRDLAVEPAGALLLYGPRGCGKSHLAHALAGELHLQMVKVNVAAAVDPWGSALPGSITDAFEFAMRNGPTMLFLEDVEAVGHRRLRFTPRGREVLDELISVLDQNDPRTVLIIASTSSPWLVNPAIRGAGRLATSVLVGPPDEQARAAAFEQLRRARSINVSVTDAEIAELTVGCTNDDLAALFSAAAELALRDSHERQTLLPINRRHIDQALGRISRSATDWFDTAYNFPEFTDDSSEFDPLFDYIRRNVRRPV